MTVVCDLPDAALRAHRLPKIEQELDGSYFTAARSRRLDEIKQPERDKVLRHLLDKRDERYKFRLLSNPGCHWHFERMVEHELGEYKAYFVGIERSWPTLEFGLQYMPGRMKQRVRVGDGNELTPIIFNNKAASVFCSIEDWPRLSGYLPKTKVGIREVQSWDQFSQLSAFWIDIWAPCLRIEFARLLRMLPAMVVNGVKRVPYAITCQYGRDPLAASAGGSVESRAEGIAAELTVNGWRASTTDCWHYYGHNDTRMMTVCGVMEWYRCKNRPKRLACAADITT